MIPDSFIEELRLNCDIEQILSPYVLLKRAGRNLKGLCPFHSEKSPSFVVYPESQSFYCFGCGAGGDVLTFIKRAENLEYVEAVKMVAEKMGMRVPDDAVEDKTAKLRMRVLEMNRETARFFHDTLMGDGGKVAREYLAMRQMPRKMVTKFGVGYAPDTWDSLREHLRSKGFSYEEMQAAALVATKNGKSYYDCFRGRVMFPLIDLRGNVIGFGGRILGEGGPKYLNSADTIAFKKSRNLFAMNFAKQTKENRLILAEGYMDVIAIWSAGFDNAVATLGTALTPEQARIIAQYTQEVIIAYDSDAAGQTATKRAIKLFSETGVKVKVLTMEGAKDPDEYIKKFGAARFKLLMDGSANAVEFEINALKAKYDVETDDGRVRFFGDFSTMMADVASPIERDVYIGKWAAKLGVSKEAVLEQVKSVEKRLVNTRRKKERTNLMVFSQDIDINKKDNQRAKYLQYALAEDKLIVTLLKNNDYYEYISNKISPEDIITDSNREIFTTITKRLQENKNTDIIAFAGILSEGLLSRMSYLLAGAEGQRFSREQADEFIDKIKSFKLKKDDAQVSAMGDEEFDEYFNSIAQKKRK